MLKDTQKHIDPKKLRNKDFILPEENKLNFYLTNSENPILKTLVNIAYKEQVNYFSLCAYRCSVLQLTYFEKLQKLKRLPKKITLILSDSIPYLVKPTYNYLKDNKNFETHYINTHAKWFVANDYFVNSSANSNSDWKTESLSIINNKEICKKYLNFVEEIKNGRKI